MKMTKLITATERIEKARGFIEKARKLERSEEVGWLDFSYTAQVKDFLRQAKEMIKFIGYTSGIPNETKEEAKKVYEEIAAAEKELLHS
jgi:ABC-type Na+ transport system ATPase subunit NatA